MSFYIKKEGGPPIRGRIERITRKFKVDTQRVRGQLIREFEDLVQYCLKRAKMLEETKKGDHLSKAYVKKAKFKEFVREASVETLAIVLRRLAVLSQTKVYLLWKNPEYKNNSLSENTKYK